MNPQLEKQAKRLQKAIREKDQEELAEELKNQLSNKFTDLFQTIEHLNNYNYERATTKFNKVWAAGTTSLFDYPTADSESPVVIFIPSLINRSYILDISKQRSFLQYLQRQNIHSYLVDWGEPADDELEFSLDDYIAGRLDKVVDFVASETGRKVILAGYCMGGLMALASSLRNKEKVKALALFACPWDFHVDEFARFKLDDNSLHILDSLIASSHKISANIIQSIFYYLHPELIQQKFENFFLSIDNDKNMDEFAALEYWVNDGISMTRKVAEECFIGWVHNNNIKNGQWFVREQEINPAQLNIPTLFVTSQKDNIVPKTSSLPLIDRVSNKKIIEVDAGHLGMIAGSRAKNLVWNPFVNWAKDLAI